MTGARVKRWVPKTPREKERYAAAVRKKQAEDAADKMSGREIPKKPKLTPLQKVVFENADKLGGILARITTSAMKTSNDDLRDHALRGLQRIGKQAARLEKELEEYT